MTILLGILKVIGIILLVILLILLTLIIFVLISPIRYESAGAAGPDDIQLRLKISWLLKILRIKAGVTPDRIRVEVKVLFLRVFHRTIPWHYPLIKKEDTEPGKEEDEPKSSRESDREPELKQEKNAAAVGHVKEKPKSEPKAPERTEQPLPEESASTEAPREAIPDQNPLIVDSKEREPWTWDRLEETAEKKAEELNGKTEAIHDKVGHLAEKAEQVRGILEDPSTWKTVRLVKNCVIRLIRHILPKKCRVHGRIGTGDPSLTAKILGIFYLGYPLYGDHGEYRLIGDFENKLIKGKYYIKGRIVPGLAACIAVRLLLNRNIRRLIFR